VLLSSWHDVAKPLGASHLDLLGKFEDKCHFVVFP